MQEQRATLYIRDLSSDDSWATNVTLAARDCRLPMRQVLHSDWRLEFLSYLY